MVCRKSHLSANPEISSSIIRTINQHSGCVAVIDEGLIYLPDGSKKDWRPMGDLRPGKPREPVMILADPGGNE